MSSTTLGRLQLRILQVLWECKRASARDITDRLNESEPVAHSTVQTLLRTLEQKGTIGHEVEGRTFVFFPLVEESRVRGGATRDLLNRLFEGRVGELVSHLLRNESVSREELDAIRDLIDQKRDEQSE